MVAINKAWTEWKRNEFERGLTLGLLSKFTFSRSKDAYELLSNFQGFNFKKFVLNTGSLWLVYIFRMQRTLFTRINWNFNLKFTFKNLCQFNCLFWNNFSEILVQNFSTIFYNFSIVTSVCPKYYCTQLSCAKTICREI